MTPNIPYRKEDGSDIDVSIVKITNEFLNEQVSCTEKDTSIIYKVPINDDICILKIKEEIKHPPEKEIIDDNLNSVNEVCDVDIYLCNELLPLFKNKIEPPLITIEKIEKRKEKISMESQTDTANKWCNKPQLQKKTEILYECNECMITYKNLRVFLNHQNRHLRQQAFPCKFCHLAFEKQATLKYHTIVKHGDIRDLMTEAQKNKLAEEQEKRMTEKQKTRKHECDECHLMFWKKGDLETHSEKVHYGQYEKRTKMRHVCRKCNKSFKEQLNFLNHMDDHGFDLKFGCKELQCKECKRWFHRIIDLMIHIQKQHSEEKFLLCPKDNKLFTDENYYKKHMESHHTLFQCSRCDSSFTEKALWFEHLELNHSQYRCNICNQSFTSKIGLNVHERSRLHKELTVSACGHCGKEFSSKSDFKIHLRTHLKKNPYKCAVCNESFQGYSILAAHSRFHAREKKHKCGKCDKIFQTLIELTLHEKTAHLMENKIFKCVECNVKFSTKKELVNHTRRHRQSRYECKQCNMVLIGLKLYQDHMNLHEKRKKFSCNECGKKFILMTDYLKHLKTHKREIKEEVDEKEKIKEEE